MVKKAKKAKAKKKTTKKKAKKVAMCKGCGKTMKGCVC